MPAVCWLLIDMDYFNNSIENESKWGWEEEKEQQMESRVMDIQKLSFTYGITRVCMCTLHARFVLVTAATICWPMIFQLWLIRMRLTLLIFVSHLFCCAFFFSSCVFSFGSQTVNTWNNNSRFCVALKMPW